jgi:hypothetical protein
MVYSKQNIASVQHLHWPPLRWSTPVRSPPHRLRLLCYPVPAQPVYASEKTSVSGARRGTRSAVDRRRASKTQSLRTVTVYFIGPSRYDDLDVETFRWVVQPTNTLTVLAALNDVVNESYANEHNFRLETIVWDEVCDGFIGPETIGAIRDRATEDTVEVLIGITGVQSNQYPRARDLALQFVA